MKKSHLRYLILILTICVLGVVFYHVDKASEHITTLNRIDAKTFWLCSLSFVLSQIVYAYKQKIFLKFFSIPTTFNENFGLISAQSFGNFLPLSGGVISNMSYLKHRKSLSRTDFLSFFTADMFIKFFTFGVLGSFFLLYSYVMNGKISIILLCLLLGMGLLSVTIFLIPEFKNNQKKWLISKILVLKASFKKISRAPKLIFVSINIHIIVLFLIAFRIQLFFVVLGTQLSFVDATLITIFANVIRVASILPANIGLREAVITGSSMLLGVSQPIAFIAAILDRLLSMLWIVFFGIIYALLFSRVISKERINEN